MTEQTLDLAARIRAVEYKLLDLFASGEVTGTVHTCVGQELGPALLQPHLRPGVDAFFATHRGHGFYLAWGGPVDGLLAELAGREGAVCGGWGGTQHLCYRQFFSNGIQASGALHATGYAWALKLRSMSSGSEPAEDVSARSGSGGIVVAQIGDGTLGEGALYEAFTFAVLLQVPVLFLLEHNGYAQSTATLTTTPGDLLARAAGFGLPAGVYSDLDQDSLSVQLGAVVDRVRSGGGPFLQIIETRRLLAHSKGDDDRPPEVLKTQWSADPLGRSQGWTERYERAQRDIAAVAGAVMAQPRLGDTLVSAWPPGHGPTSSEQVQAAAPTRIVDALNHGLLELMREDARVVVLGEDLQDPYGGAFKVTRGLSTAFPDRVFSTPIAEAGIVGVANGLALAGMRPVAEIMFGDFVTLAADQLINAAAKVYAMYGHQVCCPIVCRVVSGGGRGYGPTHSQSLERLFCGVPGIRVLALSGRHDAGRLLRWAVEDDSPTVFVEHKSLYPREAQPQPPLGYRARPMVSQEHCPSLAFEPDHGGPARVTVVTYGGTAAAVEAALEHLVMEHEIWADYLVVTQLWPLEIGPVADSVRRTGRLLVVEDSVPDYGFGAAVLAAVSQALPQPFRGRTLGAAPVPLPAAPQLERQALPSTALILSTLLDIVATG